MDRLRKRMDSIRRKLASWISPDEPKLVDVWFKQIYGYKISGQLYLLTRHTLSGKFGYKGEQIMYDDYDYDDRQEFYDPGGHSALRAGKRVYPCPTCERENMLTKKDVKLGYQCDICADQLERGY